MAQWPCHSGFLCTLCLLANKTLIRSCLLLSEAITPIFPIDEETEVQRYDMAYSRTQLTGMAELGISPEGWLSAPHCLIAEPGFLGSWTAPARAYVQHWVWRQVSGLSDLHWLDTRQRGHGILPFPSEPCNPMALLVDDPGGWLCGQEQFLDLSGLWFVCALSWDKTE